MTVRQLTRTASGILLNAAVPVGVELAIDYRVNTLVKLLLIYEALSQPRGYSNTKTSLSP